MPCCLAVDLRGHTNYGLHEHEFYATGNIGASPSANREYLSHLASTGKDLAGGRSADDRVHCSGALRPSRQTLRLQIVDAIYAYSMALMEDGEGQGGQQDTVHHTAYRDTNKSYLLVKLLYLTVRIFNSWWLLGDPILVLIGAIASV
ncbi:hypothetical protein PV08_06061 [Exophiala spinifera]|uniref:Uncharacterized protein n=1 Tax=Exophiala spinifera TaxID=91928 RepID=A0A0D2BBQ6_9EURO|nr:uncharacterized protein PV08_06061 [Exophiala spinifera]KIW16010.1 hypothetical protein PV08_06061 [Exophiala spinifera]